MAPQLRVWLASLPDVEQGLSYRADPEAPLRHLKRTKLMLNTAALKMGDIKTMDVQWADYPANALYGWAIVQPALLCHNLTSLSDSQKLQRQFWDALVPSQEQLLYFSEILEMHLLDSPVQMSEWECVQTHAFFSLIDEQSFAKAEASWVSQHPGFDGNDLPVDIVRLPLPFAALCARGSWTTFAVCDMSLKRSRRGQGGWHLGMSVDFKQGFPSMPWKIDPEELANFSISKPDAAEDFLDEIRSVVRYLQDGEDPDLERLHFYMTAFAGYVQELRGLIDFHCHGKVSKNQAYGFIYLIRCFLLSQSLRSASQLKVALYNATVIVMPKQAASIMQAALDNDNSTVPSPSTISRARGRLDVAWMLVWRDRLKSWLSDGLVVYLGTDSSPQGGRDYQIVVLDFMLRKSLPEIHTHLLRLECHGLPADLGGDMLEAEATEGLRAMLIRHVCPSVQIGSGRARSTASLKFHAVVHALRLVSGSLEDLAALFRSISVFLSDQGTESVFSLLQPVSLSDLLPPSSSEVQEEEVVFAPENEPEVDFAHPLVNLEPQPEPELVVDVTSSLEVDDLLHCIHNATKGLSSSMTCFDRVVQQCKKVADMIRRKDSKDRLIETCFSTGMARGFIPELRKFKSQVHEERWGTVADCITHLLRLKPALRYGWNLASYQLRPLGLESEQDARDPNAEDVYGVRLNVVDEAIQSDYFWGYLHGIELIAQTLERCLQWAESCPCHWERDTAGVDDETLALWRACPLRTRRCPEMAAGDFLSMVQESLSTSASIISLALPAGLTREERLEVLTDFEAARNHLLYYFHLKLQYWQEPPWCIFGMAHAATEVALRAEERRDCQTAGTRRYCECSKSRCAPSFRHGSGPGHVSRRSTMQVFCRSCVLSWQS